MSACSKFLFSRLIVDDSVESEKPLPAFNVTDAAYRTTAARDVVANVYRDGTWGAFRSVAVDTNSTTHASAKRGGTADKAQPKSSSHARAAHALLDLAKATAGQTLLINAPTHGDEDTELAALLDVAAKLGLTAHLAGASAKAHGTVAVVHDGELSSVAVAQKILKETRGQGVDIVYNLSATSVLRESLRVLAATGAAYIEGKTTQLDTSSLAWAVSKNVSLHVMPTSSATAASKVVSTFLAQHKLADSSRPASSQPSAGQLFNTDKQYIVAAGSVENVGAKLAYWLASQGAGTVHLHLTGKPSPILESQKRLFASLDTQLTVTSSGTLQDLLGTLPAKGTAVAGLFVLDSLVYLQSSASSEAALVNGGAYGADVLSKVAVAAHQLEYFAVLTSDREQVAGVQALVERRNAAGQPAVLLDVSTLGEKAIPFICIRSNSPDIDRRFVSLAVSSVAVAATQQASHPEQNFVSLQGAFDALGSALLTTGGKGVFSVLPEGKTSHHDALVLSEDETGPQDKSYLPQAVAKIMGQWPRYQ